MSLEDFLESNLNRVHASKIYYQELKKEVLRRGEELGWGVVVIDYSDPASLYNINDHKLYLETLRDLRGRKALFLCEKLDEALNIGTIGRARAHLNNPDPQHKFLICYASDIIQNPVSSCYTIGEREIVPPLED